MASATPGRRTGDAGEAAVVAWLQERGYRILERNWQCSRGELDIIACKGEILAFVEVKTRRAGAMASPLEAVTPSKQKKILLTAIYYSSQHKQELQPRFDVAAVTHSGGSYAIEYIESAFDAGDFY